MTHKRLTGIVPVLPTPFIEDRFHDAPDYRSLERLIGFCVDKGFAAVCLPAYASEYYKLTLAERYQLVETAVDVADGRIQVIAQSNHYSADLAARIAFRNQELGADMVSVAIPRMFEISERDVYRFLESVLVQTSVPVLVQDFNPGGATISGDLAKRLNADYPQFCYLKLEQALMAPKVAEVLEETSGAVQVLEGWGGLYLLEGVTAGICGAMPGLAVADVLQDVFDLATGGRMNDAADLFQNVLPYLVFSLQNMELLIRMEKQLLHARSLIASDRARAATLTPDPETEAHIEFLIRRLLGFLRERDQR